MIKREFADAWKLAKKSLEQYKEINKKYYDRKTNIIEIKIGDKILVKKIVKNKKFDYAWKGPYTVIKVAEKYVQYKDGRKNKKIGMDYIKLAKAIHNFCFLQKIPEEQENIIQFAYIWTQEQMMETK